MNRAQRRRAQHTGVVNLDEITSPNRLKYELTLNGGLLRSEFPNTQAGVITGDEISLIRDTLSKMIESMYANCPREEFAKVFAGVMCDVLGPAGARVRGLIAYGLIEGLGLLVADTETTYCPTCGVEKTELDPDPEHKEALDSDTGDVIETHVGFVTEPGILVENIRKYPRIAPEEESKNDANNEDESVSVAEARPNGAGDDETVSGDESPRAGNAPEPAGVIDVLDRHAETLPVASDSTKSRNAESAKAAKARSR